MQQKRTRSSKPKLFQCTGYGDCNMVFTRSEHLARHSRKHTGEKPFVCVIPECTKAFSRFDNMMQHTQTHRNSQYNIISNNAKDHQERPGRDTRSSTRAQTKRGSKSITKAACEEERVPKKPVINNQLYIQTQPNTTRISSGLVSPVSLTPSSPQKRYHYYNHYTSSSSEEEDEDIIVHTPPKPKCRRLSVADLCNPTNAPPICTDASFIYNLTKDEFEALEGFGRFRHTPSVFSDSLKDLASHAHIEQRY